MTVTEWLVATNCTTTTIANWTEELSEKIQFYTHDQIRRDNDRQTAEIPHEIVYLDTNGKKVSWNTLQKKYTHASFAVTVKHESDKPVIITVQIENIIKWKFRKILSSIAV
jgi:hypothetical protein